MTDRKPTEDLRDGLGLLFRAARGIAKEMNAEKLEKTVQSGARELVRVINTVGRAIGSELEKATEGEDTRPTDVSPAPPSEKAPEATDGEPPKSKPEP